LEEIPYEQVDANEAFYDMSFEPDHNQKYEINHEDN